VVTRAAADFIAPVLLVSANAVRDCELYHIRTTSARQRRRRLLARETDAGHKNPEKAHHKHPRAAAAGASRCLLSYGQRTPDALNAAETMLIDIAGSSAWIEERNG